MATSQAVLPRPRAYRVPFAVPVSLYKEDRLLLVLGVDLSPAGVFLATATRPAPGTRVHIEIGLGDDRFLVDAEVVRVDPGRGIGLRFLDLARDARLAIVEFVAREREELEAEQYRRQAGMPGPRRTSVPGRSNPGAKAREGNVRFKPARERSRNRALRVALALAVAVAAAAAIRLGTGRPARATPQSDGGGAEALAAAGLPAGGGSHKSPASDPAGLSPALAAHLAQGAKRLALGDLSVPRDDSALDHFRAALVLEPGNTAALSGVAAVIDAYVERASGRAMAGDRSGAEWRYLRALEILENDPAARALSDREARSQAVQAAMANRPQKHTRRS